jgi:hypothetical protein
MVKAERKDKVMIFDNRPLFLENPERYTYDVYEGKYKLTDKATKEARKSYEKFYKRLEEPEEIAEK